MRAVSQLVKILVGSGKRKPVALNDSMINTAADVSGTKHEHNPPPADTHEKGCPLTEMHELRFHFLT